MVSFAVSKKHHEKQAFISRTLLNLDTQKENQILTFKVYIHNNVSTDIQKYTKTQIRQHKLILAHQKSTRVAVQQHRRKTLRHSRAPYKDWPKEQ